MMDWTPPPPLACSLTPIHAPTPCLSITSINSGRKGTSRLAQIRLAVVQRVTSARFTRSSYRARRGREELILLGGLFNRVIGMFATVAGCRNQLIHDLALDSFAGRCVILGGARQQLSAQLQTQLLPQFVASSSSFRFDS